MLNSLDVDQDLLSVGPDLLPNCLQMVICRRQKSLLARKGFNIHWHADISSRARGLSFGPSLCQHLNFVYITGFIQASMSKIQGHFKDF